MRRANGVDWWQHVGFCARPPKEKSDALADCRALIGTLEPGEIVVYLPRETK